MASETDICNRGLQLLGEANITSLSEDSPTARACNSAYDTVRDAELRRHPWSFAVKRSTLAESSTDPDHGYEHAFPLPSDYIRLLPPNTVTDWQIEQVDGVGRCILTNDGDTLKVRYVARITDTSQYDALFIDALAARLAFELCERITQSTQKKREAWAQYQQAVRDARKVNAFEKVSDALPEDPWITARL